MIINKINPFVHALNPNYHPFLKIDQKFFTFIAIHHEWPVQTQYKDEDIRDIFIGPYLVSLDVPNEKGDCNIVLYHREKKARKDFFTSFEDFTETLEKVCQMAVADVL